MTLVSPSRSCIMVVDDMPANIEILLGALEDEYDILIANSGRKALALLGREPCPDLILLDVMMPEMDGFEVLAEIQRDARTRDIPVIFVTAKTDADSESGALAAGAVDFIHKPVNIEVVRARVRLHLALRQHVLALSQSLAEIRRAEGRLQVLSMAIEQSPTSIVITGADARILYVNPRFCEESGYSAEEAIGQNPRILNSGLNVNGVFEEMWAALLRGEPWKGELINRRKNGEIYWEEAHIAPVKGEDGKTNHYVAVKLDVTERKQADLCLTHLAHHDALTDLPNRALFFEHVAQGLAEAKRNASQLALMFIDLDKFKPVNDRFGHAVGDQVLQVAARRMSECVRASDSVGRIGGDEFVVLLRDISGAEDALKVAENIRLALRAPISLAERRLVISSSIGIALYPEHGEDATEIAKNADRAMYFAKARGRDCVGVFEPGMDSGFVAQA